MLTLSGVDIWWTAAGWEGRLWPQRVRRAHNDELLSGGRSVRFSTDTSLRPKTPHPSRGWQAPWVSTQVAGPTEVGRS